MTQTLDLRKRPGPVNGVSVTVAFFALCFGYLSWFYVPEWWAAFQVTGIMREVANEAYRERDDRVLLDLLVKKCERVHFPLSRDNFRIERHPYTEPELTALNATPKQVSELRRRGKGVTLRFYFEGAAKWPLVDRYSSVAFERDVSASFEGSIDDVAIKSPGCNCDKSTSLF